MQDTQKFIAGRKQYRLPETKLLGRDGIKTHSFEFVADLTKGDDTMMGMPEFIQTAFTTMLKGANKQKNIVFEERLENVAIEFFPTPKGRRFFSVVTGAQLGKFKMWREGKGDDAAVVKLSFIAVFPGRQEIHAWTWDHKKADVWASFEPQQGEIFASPAPNGSGEDVEDEDEPEEDEEDELSAQERRKAEHDAKDAANDPAKVARARRNLSVM